MKDCWPAAEALVRAGDIDAAATLLTGKRGGLGLKAAFSRGARHDLMYVGSGVGTAPGAPARRAWERAACRRKSAELSALAAAADFAAGDMGAALRGFNRALSRAPRLGAARVMRAAVLLHRVRDRGDKRLMSACLADLDVALAGDPDDARALRLRAEVRNDLEDFEGAREDLERMLRLAPGNDWARVELADLYCDHGRFSDAWPLIRSLERRHARKGWYWALRGRALATTGRREEGLRAMDQAARLSPRDPVIAGWRGEALRVVSRYREALCEFDRSLRVEPRFAYSYVWRGRLLIMLGRCAEALRDFDHILSRDRRLAFAPVYRGEALFKLGRVRAAALEFDRAYPHDPRHTWNPLVREGRKPGSRGRALERDLDAAVRAAPSDPWPLAFRGRCLVSGGRLSEGLRDLTDALALKPLGYALAWRGHALLRLGRPERALEDLRRARGRWPSAWAGQAYAALGRHREAEAQYLRALRGAPPALAVVHEWLAAALEAQGRSDEALAARRSARRWLGLEQGRT